MSQTFKTASSILVLLRRPRVAPSSRIRTFSWITSSCCGDHTRSLPTTSPSLGRTLSRTKDLANTASSFLLLRAAFSGSDSLPRDVLSASRDRCLSFLRSCGSLPFSRFDSSSEQKPSYSHQKDVPISNGAVNTHNIAINREI